MALTDNAPKNYATSPHLTNPLDEFTSYSYHFVMSVTDTTTAIGKMVNQSNERISTAGQNSYLAKVLTCKRPGQVIDLGDGDRAWLLMDTRRFSEYQIIAADMEHIYGTGPQENPSVPTNTLNIQVVDTTGMSFFNMLMDLFRNEIKSARLSCFFMISIVFVGHRPDGSTESTIISTCHIPAILMLMQFSLDHRGSVYDMIFMENDGGITNGSNMEAINSMGDISSINTQAVQDGSATLGSLVDALEKKLNESSLNFYKKYRNDALKQSTGEISGKLVQYMITIPEEWRSFVANQATKARNLTQQYAIEGAIRGDATAEERADYVNKVQIAESNDSSVQVTFAPNTSITQALLHILVSSKEVLDLASEEKRQNGEATLFRTVTNITSDKNIYVIHVDVIPYRYPSTDSLTVKQLDQQQPTNSSIPAGQPSKIAVGADTPKNLIVYDYIFTGQNSHILNLNIKYMPESVIAFDTGIDTGRNRLNRVSAAGGNSQTNMQAAANSERDPERSATYAPTIRRNDPILPGLRSTTQRTNNAEVSNESTTAVDSDDQIKARGEFTVSQAYLHFVSSMQLMMTIRGNPNILRKHADRQSKGGQPPHPPIIDSTQLNQINSAGATTPAEQIFRDVLEAPLRSARSSYYSSYVKPKIDSATVTTTSADGPDIMASPLFFKVNIKAPNIDYKTGNTTLSIDGNSEPLYTDKFFFDGPFISTTIKTHFESGNFTHEVELIPYILNSDDPFGNSGD